MRLQREHFIKQKPHIGLTKEIVQLSVELQLISDCLDDLLIHFLPSHE